MTLLIVTAGFYLSPADPFFIHNAFPWTWLVPLLVALRYGLGPALLSAVIIAIAFAATHSYASVNQYLYRVYFLGGFILTLLCGEFSALWSARVRQSEQLYHYAEERLEMLSTTYFMTRVSHDRLEQNLISKPATMRGAMEDLRSLISRHKGQLDHESCSELLQILSQYCSLQSAAIFPVRHHKSREGLMAMLVHADVDTVDGEAIASVGVGFSFKKNDPMVELCVQDKQTKYYSVRDIDDDIHSEYLVTVPLHNEDGDLLAILCIKDLPFLALEVENLQVLTILVDYFSYNLWASKMGSRVLQAHPDCPPDFAGELEKLLLLKSRTNTNSALTALYLKSSPHRDDLIIQHKRQVRGLDFIWETSRGDTAIIISLMPFASSTSVEGFMLRVDKWLKDVYGYELNGPEVGFHFQMLVDENANQVIEHLLEYVHED